jgi:hypothetical protein
VTRTPAVASFQAINAPAMPEPTIATSVSTVDDWLTTVRNPPWMRRL